MKTYFRLVYLFLASMMLLVACKPNHDMPANPYINVDLTTITVAETASSKAISVNANIGWKVTSTLPSWLTLDKTSGGNGNTQVTLTIQTNTGLSVRTADIVVGPDGSANGPSVTIHVSQGGSAPYLIVDKTSAHEDSTGQLDSVVITSNVAWTLSGLPSWITTTDALTGSNGATKIHFTVTGNTTLAPRSANITITPGNSSVGVKTVTFDQDVNYRIDAMSVNSGAPGNSVTLTGAFGANPVVKINGTNATVTSTNTSISNTITFTVPSGATSGPVTVTFGGKTLTGGSFTVINYSISGFSPTTLPSNDHTTPIVISGSFDPNISPSVKVNGVPASVISYTASSITINLPSGATPGKITVFQGGAVINSNTDFAVTNVWLQTSNGHGQSFGLGIIFQINNKIYQGLGSSMPDNFEVFDIGTMTWSIGPQKPVTMQGREGATCFVLNNKVYIGAGRYYNGSRYVNLNDWWEFDPSQTGAAAWRQIASSPNPIYGALGNTFILNNSAFYYNFYYSPQGIYKFDPSGNANMGSWSAMNATSSASTGGSSPFVIGNVTYFIGGFVGSDYSVTYSYKYDPTTNAVTPIVNNPSPGYNKAVFSLGGYGYLIDNTTTYKYDPSLNIWTDLHSSYLPGQSEEYKPIQINGQVYSVMADGKVFKFIP